MIMFEKVGEPPTLLQEMVANPFAGFRGFLHAHQWPVSRLMSECLKRCIMRLRFKLSRQDKTMRCRLSCGIAKVRPAGVHACMHAIKTAATHTCMAAGSLNPKPMREVQGVEEL